MPKVIRTKDKFSVKFSPKNQQNKVILNGRITHYFNPKKAKQNSEELYTPALNSEDFNAPSTDNLGLEMGGTTSEADMSRANSLGTNLGEPLESA